MLNMLHQFRNANQNGKFGTGIKEPKRDVSQECRFTGARVAYNHQPRMGQGFLELDGLPLGRLISFLHSRRCRERYIEVLNREAICFSRADLQPTDVDPGSLLTE